MPMVIIGVLLFVAKLAEFGPFASWSWWLVVAPFGVAVLWWQYADSSGLTKRREMDKMEQRKVERRERAMEALGMDTQRHKRVAGARKQAEAATRLGETADPTQAQSPAEPTRREPRL